MDKRKLLLLKYLLHNCDSGYKVLDTAKILSTCKKYKNEYAKLAEDIEFLKSYKYIDVKYIDNKNICLSMLDNTRVFQENLKSERSTRRGYLMSLIINMIFSGVMAFVGEFLAIIITR